MELEVGDPRFLPYLQVHEFEALVLACLEELEQILDDDGDLRGLERLRQELEGAAPEDINDGDDTTPSKRLKRRIPSYSKQLHGPLAASAAGLEALRRKCPHFDRWLSRLESLGSTVNPQGR